MYISNQFTEVFKLQHKGVSYKVNEKKGIVTAIAEFYMPYDLKGKGTKYFQTIGLAYVNSEKDIFDIEKGKKLAKARADKEAFVQYKKLVHKFKLDLERLVLTADNTLSKMDKYIQNQDKYIGRF